MRENVNNTVKLTLDPNNLPPLTEQQRAELAAVAAMPDETIDYSDAPELLDAFWQMANQPMPEQKTQITLRIDADVIDFFDILPCLKTGDSYCLNPGMGLIASVSSCC